MIAWMARARCPCGGRFLFDPDWPDGGRWCCFACGRFKEVTPSEPVPPPPDSNPGGLGTAEFDWDKLLRDARRDLQALDEGIDPDYLDTDRDTWEKRLREWQRRNDPAFDTQLRLLPW